VRLAEALKQAKETLGERGNVLVPEHVLADLVDAVEETLMAQKKEADIILGLAELRRWGGSE